jgi:hypothetical protein
MAVDWTAPARLMERRDDGSDLYFDFARIGEGSLVSLVRNVMARGAGDRQRIVIDAGPLGTLNIGQIVELSEREDFPAD